MFRGVLLLCKTSISLQSLNAIKTTTKIKFHSRLCITRLGFSTISHPIQNSTHSLLVDLESHIANRNAIKALTVFHKITDKDVPPKATLQKLAAVVSSGKNPKAEDGFKILKKLYTSKDFAPDEFTPVTFIFVIDSCLRAGLLDQALEAFYEATKLNISLDLPAYNALIKNAVDARRFDDAQNVLEVLQNSAEISANDESYIHFIREAFAQKKIRESIRVFQQMVAAQITAPVEFYDDMSDLAADNTDTSWEGDQEYNNFLLDLDDQLSIFAQRELQKSSELTGKDDSFEVDLDDIDEDDDDDDDDDENQ